MSHSAFLLQINQMFLLCKLVWVFANALLCIYFTLSKMFSAIQHLAVREYLDLKIHVVLSSHHEILHFACAASLPGGTCMPA